LSERGVAMTPAMPAGAPSMAATEDEAV